MKEKNVWLSPEELQHLLKGSLQWIDVAPRLTSSRTGIRMVSEAIPERKTASKQLEPIEYNPPMEKEQSLKRLEGQPVIWLLGSVGVLTLSSWFYFVIFSK